MGCPPGQACHAYCFLPIFAHGSLLCPVSRFTHFRLHYTTELHCAQLPFVTFRLHSFQPLTVHQLPLLARLLVTTGFGAVMVFVSMAEIILYGRW